MNAADPSSTPQAGELAFAIGIMSGTSMDGIDGVLLEIKSLREVAIQATVHMEFPKAVRKSLSEILELEQPTINIETLGRLDSRLGHLYAQVANQLKQQAGDQAVAVVGCHGQTIHHCPEGTFPFTLQLGNGAIVAQLSKLPVVNDFRSADLAVGGQGAPLASAFHQAVFTSQPTDQHHENRAVVNLGGIANITHLPADSHLPIIGFDTGPGNTLLDLWCQRHFQQPFDHHGSKAAAGKVQQKLLDTLLDDQYFARLPPKSSGREYFNQTWLAQVFAAHREFAHLAPVDVLATLTALTAASVAQQLSQLSPVPDTVYVCGGGVHNQTLMNMLAARSQCPIRSTSELGVDPQWVEASAFAWMAYQTMHRITATLPTVTGAEKPTIAGAIYYPD